MMTPTQALDDMQDSLVERAEMLVRSLRLSEKEAEEAGRAQASRAIEVARTAGSLAVFVNWLRYQAARDRFQAFWARKAEHRTLAEDMASQLGAIRDEVKQRRGAEDIDTTMRAVVLFLGYFRRALIASQLLDRVFVPKAS